MIVVFSGLPGVGKTTIAKHIATYLSAVYLRIDSIEQALKNTQNITELPVGSEGYFLANNIALDNCKLGNSVIIDCVNPLPLTRQIWLDTAEKTNQELISIELFCSNQHKHCQRVKERESDIVGLVPPSWNKIINRDYIPWDNATIKIDTSVYSIKQSITKILSYIGDQKINKEKCFK